jgi:hypothetical protein
MRFCYDTFIQMLITSIFALFIYTLTLVGLFFSLVSSCNEVNSDVAILESLERITVGTVRQTLGEIM